MPAAVATLPTFSFYTGPGFFDVACPTATDWIFATQNATLGRAPLPVPPDVPFVQKRPVAVWRGSLTGPGAEYCSNARVALLMQPPDRLDVAATGANADRDRVDAISGCMTGSAAACRGGHIPTGRGNFIPFDEQARRYRYVIVLDGHGAPDRWHPSLRCGQVVLRPAESLVMSPCTLMDDVVKPGVHFVPLRRRDAADAADAVGQLEQDVPRAEGIAAAAGQLWQERLTVDGILDCWEMLLHALPVTAREARRPPAPPVKLRNIRVLPP
jgi:hypothetical protein